MTAAATAQSRDTHAEVSENGAVFPGTSETQAPIIMEDSSMLKLSVQPYRQGSVLSEDSGHNSVSTHSTQYRQGLSRGASQSRPRCSVAGLDSGHSTRARATASDGHKATFVDAAAMKEKVRQNLSKPKYNVCDLYRTRGVWQMIARHQNFEKATLFVIATNALWIAVDTDNNKDQFLINALPIFQLMENFFCFFFSFEWLVRFMSFRRKIDCLRDAYVIFDGLIVAIMVVETWVFSAFLLFALDSDDSESGQANRLGGNGKSMLSAARLMRVWRMCRLVRLLRAIPEVMIMIKGLIAAARSVFFTFVLVIGLVFIFGILFKQVCQDSELGRTAFPSVGESMYFLTMHGTLLLNADYKALDLSNPQLGGTGYIVFIFFIFVLLGAVLLMNMLIGVLCEVVSAVASSEREELLVNYVRSRLEKVMAIIDEDGGGTISRDEFMLILGNMEAMEALHEVGVDVIGLVDFADFIFGDEDDAEEDAPAVELTLPEFMEVILQLRGTNSATVKDIVDLRKFVRTSIANTTRQIEGTDGSMERLQSKVQYLLTSMETYSLRMKKQRDHRDRSSVQQEPSSPQRATMEPAPKKKVKPQPSPPPPPLPLPQVPLCPCGSGRSGMQVVHGVWRLPPTGGVPELVLLAPPAPPPCEALQKLPRGSVSGGAKMSPRLRGSPLPPLPGLAATADMPNPGVCGAASPPVNGAGSTGSAAPLQPYERRRTGPVVGLTPRQAAPIAVEFGGRRQNGSGRGGHEGQNMPAFRSEAAASFFDNMNFMSNGPPGQDPFVPASPRKDNGGDDAARI
eukprot:TRINITY_DN13207_c1_g3_i1.p1 TRINITY_DN13207_c1_g3~~TRINITY_DN13207_c1_g3_i1.p1  ORF type:complete len:870 (-),score=165.18 TRINITY_DN13207_c1_g3_i1:100-2487(-)